MLEKASSDVVPAPVVAKCALLRRLFSSFGFLGGFDLPNFTFWPGLSS